MTYNTLKNLSFAKCKLELYRGTPNYQIQTYRSAIALSIVLILAIAILGKFFFFTN